jgi:hypothetical protein
MAGKYKQYLSFLSKKVEVPVKARCKTPKGIIYGTTTCISNPPSDPDIFPTQVTPLTSGENINANPLVAVDE